MADKSPLTNNQVQETSPPRAWHLTISSISLQASLESPRNVYFHQPIIAVPSGSSSAAFTTSSISLSLSITFCRALVTPA